MDYNVTVADDLSTERYASLFDFRRTAEYEIVFWPRDFSNLTQAELSQFEVVIHLAAKTNAAASFKNRDDVERVNVEQTLRLIERATAAGVRLFVFPSSTSVYGVDREIVTEDDLNCINPQSPYAESKIKIEDALQNGSMSYVICRFGTIFGTSPGMRFHTAVNKFCYQACIGMPLTVWRQSYHQQGPYLDLADAVGAIQWLIRLHNAKSINQIYNVVSGNYTVAEVIEMIRAHLDVEIDLVDTPLLNQYSYGVSCDKIASLGYIPTGSIEEGIRNTIRLLARIRHV